ncbi:MAG: hypothetical protein QOD72_1232 [Acidimicrobiaceae bacterium]|jgi:hypothetical protein|nr:hypothetical protein [Acidimicrobiaceae bacterium]
MSRFVSAFFGLFAVFALMASPAVAQSYGQGGVPTVQASSAAPAAGSQLTLSVAGFCANSPVSFSIGGTVVGSATSDGSGNASITITAPTTPGTYTVVASSPANGSCAALVADLTITVPATVATTVVAGALPGTGSNGTWPTLRMGAISLFVGISLFTVAKIRRRPRLTAT